MIYAHESAGVYCLREKLNGKILAAARQAVAKSTPDSHAVVYMNLEGEEFWSVKGLIEDFDSGGKTQGGAYRVQRAKDGAGFRVRMTIPYGTAAKPRASQPNVQSGRSIE